MDHKKSDTHTVSYIKPDKTSQHSSGRQAIPCYPLCKQPVKLLFGALQQPPAIQNLMNKSHICIFPFLQMAISVGVHNVISLCCALVDFPATPHPILVEYSKSFYVQRTHLEMSIIVIYTIWLLSRQPS